MISVLSYEGSSRSRETSGNPNSFTSKQPSYEDIGIKLRLTPVIHVNKSITLDINAEISSLGKLGAGGVPEIGKRTVDSKIELKDGENIILGGLKKAEDRMTSTGIPFLTSIPLIGPLFGGNKSEHVETEITLYLTPYIIRNGAVEKKPAEKP